MPIIRRNPMTIAPSQFFSHDDWMQTDQPKIDMYETDNDIVVKMQLSEYNKEYVDITLSADTLTVKCEQKQESEDKDKRWNWKEIKVESFSRSITLPSGVKSQNSEAKFKNGILTLTLPKAEEAKPKTIQIKAVEG